MEQANKIRATTEMDYTQPNRDNRRDFQPIIRQNYPRMHILNLLCFCITYALIFAAGYVRDFIHSFLPKNKIYFASDTPKNIKAGIRSCVDGYAGFYLRNVFTPLLTCFQRPLVCTPSALIEIKERRRNNIFATEFEYSEKTQMALNFGSYNYLGKLAHTVCIRATLYRPTHFQ